MADASHRATGVVHLEGIPGSGKTTASQRLCELLTSRGLDAFWSREEAENHPVMPKERRRLSARPDFPRACLQAWQTFVRSNTRVAVLDGYALQSTVRFLYANLVPDREIRDYFTSWQETAAGNSSMAFFAVADPVSHYDVLLPERGADWTRKLFAYVERTPLGRQQDLRGKTGFIEFWSGYQDLCLDLLNGARIPLAMIAVHSWSDADLLRVAMNRGAAVGASI